MVTSDLEAVKAVCPNEGEATIYIDRNDRPGLRTARQASRLSSANAASYCDGTVGAPKGRDTMIHLLAARLELKHA